MDLLTAPASLDVHGWIALGILAVAVVLFVTKWLPIEVTALAIPVALLATGVLEDPSLALQGFGNHAVIAIASIFVVGGGLQESGVSTLLARGLQRVGGGSRCKLQLVVLLVAAGVSSFMSNGACVAMLIPAVAVLARRTRVPSSLLMMPLAFGAVLGGNLTLIGTAPNLLISDYFHAQTGDQMGIFEFAWVGVPVVLAGALFLAFFGRRLLPERTPQQDRLREARLPEELAEAHRLDHILFRARIGPHSGVAGKTLEECRIPEKYDLQVALVVRQGSLGQFSLQPSAGLVLQPDDQIYLDGSDEAAWRFAEEELLQLGVAGSRTVERILGRGITMAEVVLSPHSQVVGRTLKQLDFRRTHGLSVLSFWRRGAPVLEHFPERALEFGDAMLVSGPAEKIRGLDGHPDYVVLWDQLREKDVSRAPLAILLLLLAVIPPVLGLAPLAVSALAAAMLMRATRCVSAAGMRRAIDWRVLFLIIGTIPLGTALASRGVAAAAADHLLAMVSGLGPPAVLTALFFLAAAVALTTTNSAAALIL
ncbi:MAG: SLC13 family permease, partial [Planctomycetota bacterium]